MFALRRSLPTVGRTFSTTARANNYAHMSIIGGLGDTPELIATSVGKDIVRYNVAVGSGTKEKPVTSWFRVTSFAEEGSFRDFLTSLEKGYVLYFPIHVVLYFVAWMLMMLRSLVHVEAKAEMRSFTDSDGKPRSALSLVQRMFPCSFLAARLSFHCLELTNF